MKVKEKKCKGCGDSFTPFKTTDKFCSYRCSVERLETKSKPKKPKEKKQSEKSERKKLLEKARIVFNKYIRLRDQKKPCICCNKPLGKDFQAGHYFSGGGHSAVLFDEDNVHGQRFECNNSKAGNFVQYGILLEKRISKIGFVILKEKAYEVKHWNTEELKGVISYYTKKIENFQN